MTRPIRILTDEQADQILLHYGVKPMPLVRAAIKRAFQLGADCDVMQAARPPLPITEKGEPK